MSHIHIPDGILPVWIWLLGYIVIFLFLFIFARQGKNCTVGKKHILAGVIGALMLLSMSIPVPLFSPYHVNLTVLAGIILGPFYAGLAILCSNLILGLIGHGGITIIGLNTLVLTIEATIGFYLFYFLKKRINKIFISAIITVFIALITGTLLTCAIVYAGTKNSEYLICTEHEHKYEFGHKHEQKEELGHDHEEESCEHKNFDIKKFMLLILLTGSVGWTLEAIITAYIINYLNRVKPEILLSN